MPIAKYFKGEGTKVMANMKRDYGAKKGESVFYATAAKKKMKPPLKSKMPKGVSMSPKGDIGAHRQEEATKMGWQSSKSLVRSSDCFK